MMQDYAKALGNAVRDARIHAGLTQEEVAERIGMSTRTVMNIEKGRSNPELTTVTSLIRILNIDPNLVFFPDRSKGSAAQQQLITLIRGLSETEAEAATPAIRGIIEMCRRMQFGTAFGE